MTEVNWAVWRDVDGAVYRAVHGAVNWAAWGTVVGAVDRAVNGVMHQAVLQAVLQSLNDPGHPRLQDFLRSCGEVGEV